MMVCNPRSNCVLCVFRSPISLAVCCSWELSTLESSFPFCYSRVTFFPFLEATYRLDVVLRWLTVWTSLSSHTHPNAQQLHTAPRGVQRLCAKLVRKCSTRTKREAWSTDSCMKQTFVDSSQMFIFSILEKSSEFKQLLFFLLFIRGCMCVWLDFRSDTRVSLVRGWCPYIGYLVGHCFTLINAGALQGGIAKRDARTPSHH